MYRIYIYIYTYIYNIDLEPGVWAKAILRRNSAPPRPFLTRSYLRLAHAVLPAAAGRAVLDKRAPFRQGGRSGSSGRFQGGVVALGIAARTCVSL